VAKIAEVDDPMSHKHSPPRKNVHRGRSPVTTPRIAAQPVLVKESPAINAINAKMRKSSAVAHGATPGQIVSTTKTN
jgi:hypothetical protein